MTTASTAPEQIAATSARSSSILILLRLEGLVVATVAVVLYARSGASWWLFAALWLFPDMSMLGYLAGPCQGARVYNAFHSYVAPGALALVALLLPGTHAALPVALIWANHIGVDRLLGYGLKYGDGFGFTHLGPVGKKRA
jgi:uncharacterized protein DUF4260